MSFVTVGSVKGAPGATTCALLLARALQDTTPGGVTSSDPSAAPERPVLLVECDPAGGDIAPSLGLPALPGLASLALAARHGLDASMLLEHSQRAPALGTVRLLAGVAGPEQGIALEWIFSELARELAETDLEAVVDAGRIRSNVEPVVPLLRAARSVALVVVDSVASLIHARSAAETALALGAALGVVVVGPRQHSLSEISRAAGAPVIGTMGFDPAALDAALHPGTASRWRTGHRPGHNPLLVDAARIAASIGGFGRRQATGLCDGGRRFAGEAS